MDDKRLRSKLDRLEREIKDLKLNQIIGGDSWVVYRTKINFTRDMNKSYKVTFSPAIAGQYVAVAKLANGDGDFRLYGLHPDQNFTNIWWAYRQLPYSQVTGASIMVFSTIEGSISIMEVTESN